MRSAQEGCQAFFWVFNSMRNEASGGADWPPGSLANFAATNSLSLQVLFQMAARKRMKKAPH